MRSLGIAGAFFAGLLVTACGPSYHPGGIFAALREDLAFWEKVQLADEKRDQMLHDAYIGNVRAMLQLADWSAKGHEIVHPYCYTATTWFRSACEHTVVERDDVQAYKWYSLAILCGHSGSVFSQDQLVDRMTAEEITKAERFVAKWRPDEDACAVGPAQTEN